MNLQEAMLDPTKELSAEQLAQFGTIVTSDGNSGKAQTNIPAPVETTPVEPHTVSIDQKIKSLETPVDVSLKLSGEQHERLQRLCSNNSMSTTEYITSVVLTDLESKIGRASISGPSKIGDVKTDGLITGPSRNARFN
jgi:hypothetical protein